MSVPSYASPFAIGHAAIAELFDGPVVVQEKVDGSQISFCLNASSEVEIRSKGAQLHTLAPDQMFSAGVAAILALADKLTPGLVYRGEYLRRPKHNVLAYDRAPPNHVVLFDVEDRRLGEGYFFSPEALAAEAERIGLMSVPVLFSGVIESPDALRAMLDTVSCLGGAKIEGVVVKNYAKYTADKKVMMGKFVSEAFKEVHGGEWRAANPTQGDVLATMIMRYRTPARWQKAVQHLREAGVVQDSPKDIGLLIREVGTDVKRECEQEIRDALFAHFWPHIQRGIVGGLPEWYKGELLKNSFAAALSEGGEQ